VPRIDNLEVASLPCHGEDKVEQSFDILPFDNTDASSVNLNDSF